MALPVEILFGIYLGLLTGILPALVAGTLGFTFRYFTGVTVPGFAVVVLGLAIAGINGGFLGLLDETIRRSPRLVTATLVVLMITLWAHSQGDRLGAEFPRRLSLRSLRERTLSTDVIERVGGRGEVRIEIVDEIGDLEGYPSLTPELRASIRAEPWTFPADLPLAELESRMADRLRSEFDLSAAVVRIDERARATVAAAPPSGRLSKRVPPGKRAVSVSALVPTGVARGEAVTVDTPHFSVDGTVVSARTDGGGADPASGGGGGTGGAATDGGRRGAAATGSGAGAGRQSAGSDPDATADATAAPAPQPRAPTTDGGEGRVTVALDPGDAERLLGVDRGRVIVRSRGSRREYELVSLLRQAGKRFRKLTVREGGALDGVTIGEVGLGDTYGVKPVAVRHVTGMRHVPGEGRSAWVVAPEGDETLSAGDELFAVGTTDALDRLEEVAA